MFVFFCVVLLCYLRTIFIIDSVLLGQFGNPMQTKGVAPGPPPGQFGQPGPMQNGPATGAHGPQGDQYGMPR